MRHVVSSGLVTLLLMLLAIPAQAQDLSGTFPGSSRSGGRGETHRDLQ